MSYPSKTTQFTFNVGAGAGSYAPEILHTTSDLTNAKTFDYFERFLLTIGALVATGSVEFDLLKPGGDPTLDAGYHLAAFTASSIGYKGKILTDGWWGGRLRGKSGGTAGAITVSALWGL